MRLGAHHEVALCFDCARWPIAAPSNSPMAIVSGCGCEAGAAYELSEPKSSSWAFTTGRSSAPYFDDLIGGSHDRVPEVEVPTGRIQILHVPDCPLVDDVVQMVRECQDDSGDSGAPELRVGAYPSPTVVINGLDVTTGESVAGEARCRLDLPTREQILNALARDR